MTEINVLGFRIFKGHLDRRAQEDVRNCIRDVVSAAPLRAYQTPGGGQMSVRMTAAGALGWMSDSGGYRYATAHMDGGTWPDIPDSVLAIWNAVSGTDAQPNSCLVNFYGEDARMGLHRDDTEGDFTQPVVSISLGDQALFRMGGLRRGDPTKSHWLESGDVVVMGGDARLAYHGIDRIKFGSSALLPKGGRLNLTLRVAN